MGKVRGSRFKGRGRVRGRGLGLCYSYYGWGTTTTEILTLRVRMTSVRGVGMTSVRGAVRVVVAATRGRVASQNGLLWPSAQARGVRRSRGPVPMPSGHASGAGPV